MTTTTRCTRCTATRSLHAPADHRFTTSTLDAEVAGDPEVATVPNPHAGPATWDGHRWIADKP